MTILDEVRQLKPGVKDLRAFGWTVGTAFLVLWAFLAYALPWLADRGGDHRVLVYLGLALIVLGTVVPRILKPFYYVWMTLAVALGFVMTRVILTVFFVLVLIPVGLFMKLIGRDALHRKLDPDAETYWIPKEYLIADRSRFEKYF